ncbi:MAG: hypothetical protein P8L78_19100 [Mariniblastus sp.]|nr:hypothetical protein [Mariniblastus sp.]MDG2183807.1 hypothetical protein [Mariniblastus sp.]
MSLKQITTGQDSFLDIVANLVGILIILVVVVGAQASASWVHATPSEDLAAQIDDLKESEASLGDTIKKLQLDNEALGQKQAKENRLAAALTDQRHEYLIRLELLQQKLKAAKKTRIEKIAAIDATAAIEFEKKESFEVQQKQLIDELAELNRESKAISFSNEPSTEVIKHFPNPIAKTVFSDEIHFCLNNGRLSYVPMSELISLMRSEVSSEVRLNAENFSREEQAIAVVGPVYDYRMQYELIVKANYDRVGGGVNAQTTLSFKGFRMLPTSPLIGETIEAALGGDSDFQKRLSDFEPGKTTVSIWVYPNDFESHASLKKWIYENGFQMASWPLDHGKRISGGPTGFKTSAQ